MTTQPWTLLETLTVLERPTLCVGGTLEYRRVRLTWNVRIEHTTRGPLDAWRVWAVADGMPTLTVGTNEPEMRSLSKARTRARQLAATLGDATPPPPG